jgi:hypothetical protein
MDRDVAQALSDWQMWNSTGNTWASIDIQFTPFKYARVTRGTVYEDGTKEQALVTDNYHYDGGHVIITTQVHV